MNALKIYEGSDGAATTALYERLVACGRIGEIAMNLFRAHKCSGRAKEYSRRYKGDAYGRKVWSIGNAVSLLLAGSEGLTFGWKKDPEEEFAPWVFYVDTTAGQISYHMTARGNGPDYPGEWDQQRGAGASRICAWVQAILDAKEADGPNKDLKGPDFITTYEGWNPNVLPKFLR